MGYTNSLSMSNTAVLNSQVLNMEGPHLKGVDLRYLSYNEIQRLKQETEEFSKALEAEERRRMLDVPDKIADPVIPDKDASRSGGLVSIFSAIKNVFQKQVPNWNKLPSRRQTVIRIQSNPSRRNAHRASAMSSAHMPVIKLYLAEYKGRDGVRRRPARIDRVLIEKMATKESPVGIGTYQSGTGKCINFELEYRSDLEFHLRYVTRGKKSPPAYLKLTKTDRAIVGCELISGTKFAAKFGENKPKK